MKVKVVDSTFSHNATIGLGGENMGKQPENFQWDFEPGEADIKFFTDLRLLDALDDNAIKKVGLLIEPMSLAEGTQKVYEGGKKLLHMGKLDTLLAHNQNYVDSIYQLGLDCRLYMYGGSWLKDWAIFPKSKLVSILVSHKKQTDGHKLRHKVVSLMADLLDVYGEPYTKYTPKVVALRDYYYSVIVESSLRDTPFFSERLVDCLSQGTIPIHYGSSVSEFFDMNGILSFSTLDELANILARISVEDYNNRIEAITRNLELAKQYRCPEDWIFEHYPDLFKV